MDRLYIVTGFAWLIAGMMFGVYVGITDQLHFSNSHAHANLLGFVISVLFGLLCRNWPALMAQRLATAQFALYQAGAVVLVAGKYDIDNGGGGSLAPIGSILILLGTLLMVWMFVVSTREVSSKPAGALS